MPIKCHAIGCSKPSVSKGLCDTHRKRRDRHGDAEKGRPQDWGQREKHIAYHSWLNMRRHHSTEMPVEWAADFWAFVKAVPEKPNLGKAHRIDPTQRWSSENFYWKESRSDLSYSEDKAAYMRAWHKQARDADPDRERAKSLKRYYGVTLDWYNERLVEQGGVCAICKKPETTVIKGNVLRLAVDHCHDSKKVRGLLCRKCNQSIGMLNHDPDLLLAAIEYLENTK